MYIFIDISASVILLFFFLTGWHKGWLISLLGVLRVILAYGGAYFAGRYLGLWLGGVLERPRIVMVPVVAGLTFLTISLVFHFILSALHHRKQKPIVDKEDEDAYEMPLMSRIGGSLIHLTTGLFSVMILFYLVNLFAVGATGAPFPGEDKAVLGRLTRWASYHTAERVIPLRDDPEQTAAIARLVSQPDIGVRTMEYILHSESFRLLSTDARLPADLLSGDPDRIEQNASIQHLLNDRPLLEELRRVGVLSGKESRQSLCEKLARAGQNEKIRSSMEDLRARNLLTVDKLPLLIRDREFDIIVAELLR